MSKGFSYLEEDVKAEIRRIVKETLKKSSFTDPPVKIEPIYEENDLQLRLFHKDHPNFIELVEKVGADADALRGVLYVDKRLAVARDDGYDRRNRFVFGHELGHWDLPWHKELLYKCTQFDLSPNARKQMEREANFYSSELLFMGNIFKEMLHYSNLSINQIKRLSDRFQMSKESTLRRAVEIENRPCAFICCTVNEKDDNNFLKVKYAVHSDSFIKKYGEIERGQSFHKEHPLSKIKSRIILTLSDTYETNIRYSNGEKAVILKAEVWYNGYDVLALFQPQDN